MYICIATGARGVEPAEAQRKRRVGRQVGGQQAATAKKPQV